MNKQSETILPRRRAPARWNACSTLPERRRRAASRWSPIRTRCTAAPWTTRWRRRWRAPSSALGYVAARFNFRGVGASEGVHDDGTGETDDMAIMLAHMRAAISRPAGGAVRLFVRHLRAGATAAAPDRRRADRPSAWCWSARAAGKWAMPDGPGRHHPDPRRTRRHHHRWPHVLDWARPQDIPVIVIPGADHFFHRKLGHIKNLVTQLWRREHRATAGAIIDATSSRQCFPALPSHASTCSSNLHSHEKIIRGPGRQCPADVAPPLRKPCRRRPSPPNPGCCSTPPAAR